MTRSQVFGIAALLGLVVLGSAGCHQDSGPPITPQHPVALPPPSGFTAPPGKGGMVGQLPSGGSSTAGGGGSVVNPQSAGASLGSKAH